MMITTFVLRRYNNELQTSEVFSTAGRTVKSGLVSSAVVSSWTWAATLLQSSSVAYKYGVRLVVHETAIKTFALIQRTAALSGMHLEPPSKSFYSRLLPLS